MFIQKQIKMGDFSSYYKYEKFEVIGDELIPLGIYSIDADGTMPYVVKEECDTACGCIEPQYRWIQTEDTICIEVLTQTVSGSPYCVGYDRYEDVYSQVSYDNGVTWETTATTSTMIEENSSACGYVPPTPTTEYRWVDDGGTTCVGVDKYNRKVKQVSYDGGSTWMNVSPLTVSATTLVEANSPDCGYVAPQYRTISGDPYCNGVDKYEDVYSQVSYDGGSSWETTATTVTLVQAKSTDCGFSARTISTATTCVGVDKHYLDEYQESSDSGATWTTISSSTGTLIEAKSADCGYAERTISGTPYCDGADLVVVTSAQTSSDSGSTWTTVSTAITMVESGSSQCHQTVHVTGVTLNKNSMSLNSGSSETLVATVSPSNADDKSVTWSSNNTSVATVNSSGLVSAVTSGSATITVTTTDGGYTAQCSVSVSVPTPPTPTIDGKFTLTLSDSSTVSAECDSTSAITKAEISAYTFTTVSAEIGDCVTTIGDNTFENCSGLTSVVISNGVTNIGQFAFYNCSGLTSVVIPDNVTSIMYGAFQRCTSITSCTIGDGIVTISSSLFRGCSSLSRITIPNNITSLGNSSFSGCTSLSTITIPNSVTSIGYTVFQNCSGLTSVTIGSGATSIGNSAFANCKSLQSITCLATTPATLGGLYTFYNTNNCPIYVPCESVSAYQTAWDGLVDTSRIQALPNSDYQGIYSGVLSNGTVSIMVRITGSTLTSGNVSSHREDTVRANIGTAITAIDDNTFSGFTMLTEVNIASTVTTIGNNAFKDCPQMNIIRVNATTPPALGSNVFDGTNDCPIQVPCGYASTYKSASGWSTYASRII